MIPLSSDETFHFELLRTLSLARYFGADIAEVLEAVGNIEPGNFESFHDAFSQLASRVFSRAEQIDATAYPVSARDAYFHASSYFRAADFFLHGNAADPRINDLWEKQTIAFDKAISLLPIPGERLLLHADGFDVPAIFFRATSGQANPRPTLILGNGYDGAQEEMLHGSGFAALERGYHVILYEGPGQPTVRRNQGRGFIHDWEKCVTPVVDYLEKQPEVDVARIGLLGFSLGGYLAVRAAAFEHRLAAVFAIDGVWNVYEAFASNLLPPEWKVLFEAGDKVTLNARISEVAKQSHAHTGLRWGTHQGLWAFNVENGADFLQKVKSMTLDGLEDQIQCPVYVGDAADEQYFQGQPAMVKQKLGDKATLRTFTAADGAGSHCHIGASVLLNHCMLDWFHSTVSKK